MVWRRKRLRITSKKLRPGRGSTRKVVEKVEEPIVESPIEAVPDKVVEKVGEVVDKVEEPQEAEEKPLLLSKLSRPLLDLEVEKEEIFRQKAAARHSRCL